MPNAREYALHCFSRSLNEQTFLTIEADCPDSPFVHMLTTTAFRRLTDIRQILSHLLHKPLPAKHQKIYQLLCLGATELLFMNTADYACLNEWVSLAKKLGNSALGGLVNAVLRRLSADKSTFLAQPPQFFPDSFLSILKQDYSSAVIADIAKASLSEPPLALSVKADAPAWAERLGGLHLAAHTVILRNAGKIPALAGFNDGAWWVQDYAASIAVTSLGNLKGKRVLDLCAAPGGKTAQLINAGAIVTSLDSSAERLQTLRQNLKRLHFAEPEIIAADALQWLQTYQGPAFDIILLDAPCSATGIFRRHPEIIHFKTKADVQKQAALQKQILDILSRVLAPHGLLAYCVCSIAKAEGVAQIRSFLKRSAGTFAPQPITAGELLPSTSADLSPLITPEGFVSTLPSMLPSFGGVDAFFIAKLQKVK